MSTVRWNLGVARTLPLLYAARVTAKTHRVATTAVATMPGHLSSNTRLMPPTKRPSAAA